MRRTLQIVAVGLVVSASFAAGASAQRPATSRPDLSGLWSNGTVTPLQRPPEFAEKSFLTQAEAAEYERTALDRLHKLLPAIDLQFAPDVDYTYMDRAKVVPSLRSSLIIDPPDGRLPPLLPEAKARADARPKPSLDDPETLGLDERCLLETALGSSNASPPMVPNPFGQNLYQIVQTAQHLVIYTEVVHDARLVRIGGTHPAPTVQLWLGDSIGHWEGQTLVVDTTNFTDKSHFRGSGSRLHVVERFTRTSATTIDYKVTAEDPDTWARPWTAEIPFSATTERIFEYACHEGNRYPENALRGARAGEKQKEKERSYPD